MPPLQALVNMPEPELGATALMMAAQAGDLDFVKILISKGAEIDQVE